MRCDDPSSVRDAKRATLLPDGDGPTAGVEPVGRESEVPGGADGLALQLDPGGQEEPR